MLKHLFVKNFVLIDECELDFETGFSAFTGETGAGKSILIDAMSLLAGDRASSTYIKQNADYTLVRGIFDVSDHKQIKEILIENSIPVDQTLVLERKIYRDGRSQINVNEKSCTLTTLKECVSHLIDIHSQHDTQYLLNKSSHIRLLDQILGNQELVNEVKDLFECYSEIKKEFNEACNTKYNENDLGFIQSEIDEIERANLLENEDEDLEARQKEFQQFEKTYQKTNASIELLEKEGGISELLYEIIHLLDGTDSTLLQDQVERLNNYYNEIIDVGDSLKDYVASMNISEEELNELQSRLYEIQRLKRKYGPSIEAILRRKEEMIKQVQLISNRNEYIAEMESKIKEYYDAFYEKAKVLQDKRKVVALSLQTEIEKHCHDLMLPNAKFVIDFQECEANARGIDDIEFYISMNIGEMPRPLTRVASGGELSRLMLALKTIFTRLEGIQTVIFDEIDSGVSGPVATSIGLKMAILARDVQVFSVTHLAQVASCAKNHYFVSKEVMNQMTITQINKLDTEQRIEQLAIISSGSVTPNSLALASELLNKSQDLVQKSA